MIKEFINFDVIKWLILLFLFILIVFLLKKKNSYNENKEFSKCESPIERQLFLAIRKYITDEKNNPVRVYSQIPCGRYRIDLVIFSKTRKIAIECDGKAYHSSPEQIAHDRKKDIFLKRNGWDVIRFTGSDIYNNAEGCCQVIQNLFNTRKSLLKRLINF